MDLKDIIKEALTEMGITQAGIAEAVISKQAEVKEFADSSLIELRQLAKDNGYTMEMYRIIADKQSIPVVEGRPLKIERRYIPFFPVKMNKRKSA